MKIDGAGNNNPSDAQHETASHVRSFLLEFGTSAVTAEEVNRRWQGEGRERTAEEDEKLRNSVERFEGDWLKIGEHLKVPRISEGEGMNRLPYFLESNITEKEDKVLNEYANAIEGSITGRTAEQFVKRWHDDLKNSMNMKSGTEDAESGDFSGSKKNRHRSFPGSSSAASLLPRKLQRLSLQDRALAAAASSAAALYASALSQLCDEVAHQVEQRISSERWHDDLESSMNMKSLTRRFGSWDKADRDGSRRYRGRSLCESSSAESLLPQSLQHLSLQDRASATAADASSSSAMARDSEEGVVNLEKKSGESCFSDCSPTS